MIEFIGTRAYAAMLQQMSLLALTGVHLTTPSKEAPVQSAPVQ